MPPDALAPTATDPDLAQEQAHLATARAALRRMRERAAELFATGETVAGDGYGAESLGAALAGRVAALADHPDTPLFFGRLDFGGDAGDHADESHHIGRRHVTDEHGEPLVLDWRAPVARAFYRASASDPLGVRVRRRFGFAAGALTSFEDEHLDRGEELGTGSALLTAEIERPRVGPMRDIVATIQPEQDELVRAGLDQSICVQGAPGTGKTAVGLHRAAYLLYAYREQLRKTGVLVVGPNQAFLRYIAAVLPALGEVEVRQATIDDLIARGPLRGTEVRGTDPPETAALKHDPRLAEVLSRALWSRVRPPAEPLVVPDGGNRWRLSIDDLTDLVDQVRREAPPYLLGRERVQARVVAALHRQAEVRRAESPGDSWTRRLARSRPVTQCLDAVWPKLTPEQLIFLVLSDPGLLAEAATDLLDPAEQATLRWARPPRSVKATRWSDADTMLLDEAAGLLERLPSFGHIVVDEAQDLSPMQARALARRCRHGSVTILGDLAQGTAPWAAADWRETLAHLTKPAATISPLTTGFRVPATVLALANRLLPSLAVDVPPAESLRRDGELVICPVPELAPAVVAEVTAALAVEGSIAVIAADAAVDELRSALAAANVSTVDPSDPAPDPAGRVTVVPATLAKGLEYDHVIAVEPATIASAEARGLHRLYVVLTRAVSRLTVLHAQPLPAPLRD
ncbi:AAA family ATPase [Natronosporangium hydrolyticum]|uniref:AAA family ATPase n=1 Tax=Natronosporangium hydrolyticum TaxID=2811111 RepID=A0A895YDX7_9ACTN|nr:AAA family ATPase [Natronosporangium hydrolyticum]QSB14372.1 AAA family ATPase [Natronosporangium hydrolyticum]